MVTMTLRVSPVASTNLPINSYFTFSFTNSLTACHFHGSAFGQFLFTLYFVKCSRRYQTVYFRYSHIFVQFNDSTLD
ncbi:hypothetical protein [Bacteroides caecimuris]|uniref:hypothetical protein n=2 Tax=Bacteroides TaxID=816 RepID=UPI0026EEB694|nr:hypothetical protein [Bacteroides caecimuris]